MMRRVLVVNGHGMECKAFNRHFDALGDAYDTSFAANGEVALQMVRTGAEAFDLVLTDHHLVGLDGIQLLRALRSDGFDMPVLLMTGFADLSAAERAEFCGVLPMPFSLGTLRACLSSWT